MNLSSLSKIIFIILASLVFLFSSNTAFASNFYLTSEKNNLVLGEIIPVSVIIDTKGESINGVSAFLSYPKDKLEVAWISYGDSFPFAAFESYGDGVIEISRGSFTGEVGDITLATIGFKALTIGEATVSFIPESAAPRTSDSSDSLNLLESRGATFTIDSEQIHPMNITESEPNVLVALFEKLLSLLG